MEEAPESLWPNLLFKQGKEWNQNIFLRTLSSQVLKTCKGRDSTISVVNLFPAQLVPWGISFSLCLIWITVVQLTLCLSPSCQGGWLMRLVLCFYNLLVGRRGVWSLLNSFHLQAEQTPLLQPLPTGQVLQPWQLWGPSADHVPIHWCLSSIEAPKLAVVIQMWSNEFS